MGRQAVGLESSYKESRPVSTGAAGFQSPISCNRRSVSRSGLPQEGSKLHSEPPPCIIPEAFLGMLDSRAVMTGFSRQYPGVTIPYRAEYYRQEGYF